MKRPIIYTFHSYREYLKKIIAFHKNHGASQRSLAKKAGVSASYFTMVISSKRNLDLRFIDSISIAFEMNKQEKNFLKNLVQLNDADGTKDRLEAFRKLSRFKEFKKLNEEELVSYKYLNKWYYVAIRELSFHENFKEDPAWIQKRLKAKITRREIEKGLSFLKKNNLLGKDINPNHLNCSDGVYKLSLTKFHTQMLDQVKDSIKVTPREERKILGFTKSMSKKEFAQAKLILQEALDKIEKIGGAKDKSDVYHFYFMGIPLTSGDQDENE